MRQLIVGTGSIATGGTWYTGLTGGDAGNEWTTNDDQCRIPVPVSGTLRKLRVRVTTAAGSGNNHAFALLINGVASSLTVTISNTATEGSNVATDVSVAAGDYLALRRVNTTFNAAGLVRWSLEFEGATGESWYGVWASGQLAGGGPFYHAPFTAYGTTSDSSQSLVAIAGTITRYDVRVRVAPGVGTSHDIVLLKNGVVQNGSGGTPDTRLSISNTAITGSRTGFSLTVAPGDLLRYGCTQTGGAAATHISIGTKLVADVDGYSHLSPLSPSSQIPNGATNWTGLALQNWTTTEAAAAQTLDAAYWATALYAASGPPDVGKSYVLSLRKNGTSPAEALTVTISGPSLLTTASDTAHVLAFASGDTIAVQSVPSGTPTRVQVCLAVAICDHDPSALPPEPPGNTIIVWIDDVDRTSLVSGLRWSSTINGIGTASFTVRDPSGLFIPQDDDYVVIEVAGIVRWIGTVANPAGTAHLVHRGVGTTCQVTCQDKNQFLQRAISNGIIPPQSLRDTLVYLCDGVMVPHGVTLHPDQVEGPTLTTITSPWLTSEALVDYLATQTGYVRWINPDGELKMWEVGSVSSGVTLSAANANVRAAAYDRHRFDYRSAQWVVFGPNGVLHMADSWTGDGVTQEFPQHYRNYPGPPATITVGATTYPVGIYGVDALEWTWREGDFSLVHVGTPVGVGVAITTDYDTLFPSHVYVEGDEWVTRPWVRVDFAPHILHWDEATAFAAALIRQHQPRLNLPQVTTYVETIAVGSTVVVDFPVIGLGALTCFVRATETRVIPTGDEVLLETTLDLIGGTDDVPANSATDLWKRIIFGESASSGAIGSTSGGAAPARGSGDTGPHTLLSTTHSDVVPATVVRGDLLSGTSTPKWARLPVGPAQSVLQGNGTDVAWSATPTLSRLLVNQLTTAAGPQIELNAALLDGSDYLGSLLYTLLGGAIASIRAKEHTADNYGLSFFAGSGGVVTERLRIAGAGTVTVGQAGTPGALVVNGPSTFDNATVTGNFRTAMLTNDTGLAAGTYTPTLTGVSNVSSLTALVCAYQRVGLVVSVSGMFSLTPTAGSTPTGVGISLPIASGLYASEQLAGVAASPAGTEPGAIYADYTNDRAHLQIPACVGGAHLVVFQFIYQVI